MSDIAIQSVKTPDFEMEYVCFGDGPKKLIIIPGLSLRSVLASAAAVETAYKMFKEDYTVYLFDRKKNVLPGYSIADMAHDMAAALKALGLAHVDVFGTSQGGMVGQYLAIECPELVDHLVLASSSSKAEPLQIEVIEGWADMADALKGDELVASFIDNAFSPNFLKRYRRALLVMYRNLTEAEMRRFAIMARACKGVNSYDRLGEIKCPVFVIGAGLDHVVSYEASVKIAEKLKACGVPSEFYTYEEYGHAVYDEAPDYKDRVLNFLRSR